MVINRYKTSYSKNRYKRLQTVTKRYKPVTPQTVTKCYKQLHTVTNYLLHKPLQTFTVTVWYYGIAVSTVMAQSSNNHWHIITITVKL